MQIWLTIFVSWPAPAGAHQRARLGVRGHHRLGQLVERLVVAAAHDRELTVLGTGLAARHGRVDEADSEFGCGLGQLLGNLGRRGGVIDENRSRLGTRQARRRDRRRPHERRCRCRRTS